MLYNERTMVPLMKIPAYSGAKAAVSKQSSFVNGVVTTEITAPYPKPLDKMKVIKYNKVQ